MGRSVPPVQLQMTAGQVPATPLYPAWEWRTAALMAPVSSHWNPCSEVWLQPVHILISNSSVIQIQRCFKWFSLTFPPNKNIKYWGTKPHLQLHAINLSHEFVFFQLQQTPQRCSILAVYLETSAPCSPPWGPFLVKWPVSPVEHPGVSRSAPCCWPLPSRHRHMFCRMAIRWC